MNRDKKILYVFTAALFGALLLTLLFQNGLWQRIALAVVAALSCVLVTLLIKKRSILKIENPNAKTDRELIIFRDSFGSSMAPLLVQDYAQVTLIDIRYMNQNLLPMFVDFHGQDVLFLYSTLVLNNPDAFQMN